MTYPAALRDLGYLPWGTLSDAQLLAAQNATTLPAEVLWALKKVDERAPLDKPGGAFTLIEKLLPPELRPLGWHGRGYLRDGSGMWGHVWIYSTGTRLLYPRDVRERRAFAWWICRTSGLRENCRHNVVVAK